MVIGAGRMQRIWAFLLVLLFPVLQAQQITVNEKVTGTLGQQVTLPCTFTSNGVDMQVTQIMWIKDSINIATYSPQFGIHIQNTNDFNLTANPSSATLLIKSLRASDEGNYICEVTTFPGGNRRDTTYLSVKADPKNSAEAIPVVAGDIEVPVAKCASVNGRPPSQITWRSTLPGNFATTINNNTDGTYTVVSIYKLVPTWTADKQEVTCAISYDSKESPIPVTLSVQYSPIVAIEGYDNNWYLKRTGASLTCSAHGNPQPTSYTWKTADGSPLPNSVKARDNVLYVEEVDERVNTTIVCEVTNALGSRASQQEVLVRDKPNTSGAGATGGIIGGIIAAIVGIAVIATVIMICRQQRKNQTAEDDDLEGPPAYKPPPPSVKMQEEKFPQIQGEEMLPLKAPLEHTDTMEDPDMTPPKYWSPTGSQDTATLEDDYLEQINPIYSELSIPQSGSHREDQGFMMSPAVYV
ncbi:nectin-2beta precursor [Xenopus laevis]|uniref:Nectin-2beta n=1 Tax=Xenopus laevis TaxID=8355 RepID=D5JEJ7_XENLA|nr:nectin cell adhesion molecule 2 S homeolog precursor [Xenopus laevis]ADE34164.1 nectin-2beta [Xenopus laevis]